MTLTDPRTWERIAARVAHPRVGVTPKTLVWTKNKARLYRYDRTVPKRFREPLLIVYALVNKPFILDLIPGRSFIEYLVHEGIDVFLLDWGVPAAEDRNLRFDDLAMEYLPRAVRRVLGASGAEDLNVLGYCLGGVLTTLYAARHASAAPLRSITLLATPIDFADTGLFTRWFDPKFFDVDRVVDCLGNVPADMIGFGTKLLKPYLSFAGTYRNLVEGLSDPDFVETWGAMNRWVEESVPFAGEAYRQWVKDFYQGNKLVKDELFIGGERLRLEDIRVPLFNAAAEADHLVTLSQTRDTTKRVGSKETEFAVFPGGHTGIITSRKARDHLWPRVASWVRRHSTSFC